MKKYDIENTTNNYIEEYISSAKDSLNCLKNSDLFYNLLIEFQGEQHFKPTAFNKKIKHEIILQKFEDVKTRDAIKKKWTIDNNYKLIEISYREINKIEEILKQELCI